MTAKAVLEVLAEAKKLAQRYRTLTGKPLGITGEVAEYEAARILGLELTAARQAGYDAIEHRNGTEVRHQIKGRCVLEGAKPGQRMGSIGVAKEFDAVLLVLLDSNFEATAIYEASREKVVEALTKPGSKARNERGALGIPKFKAIGELRWKRGAPAQQVLPPDDRDVAPLTQASAAGRGWRKSLGGGGVLASGS